MTDQGGLLEFASEHSGLLSLAAILLAAVLALIVLVFVVRMTKFYRPYAALRKGLKEGDLDGVLHAQLKGVDVNGEKIAQLGKNLERLAERSMSHVQALGLVRYDAFEDIGGKQSFSLCLLDENRNGVILSSITGMNSTRAYARQVEEGSAGDRVGDEERAALEKALEILATRRSGVNAAL